MSNVNIMEKLESEADILYNLGSFCNIYRDKITFNDNYNREIRLFTDLIHQSERLTYQHLEFLPFSVNDFLSWILLNNSPPSILKNEMRMIPVLLENSNYERVGYNCQFSYFISRKM